MRLDISGDFEGVCGDFHVSATLRLSSGDVALNSCVLNTPYDLRELEPTGGYVVKHGTLFVWSRNRSVEPPIGSIVIDADGTYWTVWRQVRKHHVNVWRVVALNLNIITADANQATVLKATFRKGGAGEAAAVWRGLWTGKTGIRAGDTVPARFQPSEETAKLEFGADSSLEVYRVYFEDPVPIDLAGGEYRLVDQDGNRYRVLKYYNEQRIDRLPVAYAVRITEGEEFWDNQ